MNKEGGTNFVMEDNVQKEREKEKTEASGGGASMAIDLPSCKINIEGYGEAPLVLLPMGPMPSIYSSSQTQGSKASSQITGAKKRKSVILYSINKFLLFLLFILVFNFCFHYLLVVFES